MVESLSHDWAGTPPKKILHNLRVPKQGARLKLRLNDSARESRQ